MAGELKKGQTYKHRGGCDCFRCSKVPWNKGLKLPQFSGRNHPRWVEKIEFKCLNCGKEFTREPNQTKQKGNGNFCSHKCSGKYYIGEYARHWQGGPKWMDKQKFRYTYEYKLWRKAVLERDKHKCIWCGSSSRLQVDHIKPWSLFPELRLALDNARTLCFHCHKTTETWGGVNKKGKKYVKSS